MKRINNSSGFILLTVLLLIGALAAFAVSIGAITSFTNQYIEKTLAKTQAQAAAVSGINYAVGQITKTSTDDSPFWHLEKKVQPNAQSTVAIDIEDNTRRFNLNALNESNAKLLVAILQQHGLDKSTATRMTTSISDWIKTAKKAPLDDVMELKLLEGMTPELFDRISTDVTVYPKEAAEGLKMNFCTMSDKFYAAAMAYIAQEGLTPSVSDIKSIIAKCRDKISPTFPSAIDLAKLEALGHTSTPSDYYLSVKAMDVASRTIMVQEAFVEKNTDGTWQITRINRL